MGNFGLARAESSTQVPLLKPKTSVFGLSWSALETTRKNQRKRRRRRRRRRRASSRGACRSLGTPAAPQGGAAAEGAKSQPRPRRLAEGKKKEECEAYPAKVPGLLDEACAASLLGSFWHARNVGPGFLLFLIPWFPQPPQRLWLFRSAAPLAPDGTCYWTHCCLSARAALNHLAMELPPCGNMAWDSLVS